MSYCSSQQLQVSNRVIRDTRRKNKELINQFIFLQDCWKNKVYYYLSLICTTLQETHVTIAAWDVTQCEGAWCDPLSRRSRQMPFFHANINLESYKNSSY